MMNIQLCFLARLTKHEIKKREIASVLLKMHLATISFCIVINNKHEFHVITEAITEMDQKNLHVMS